MNETTTITTSAADAGLDNTTIAFTTGFSIVVLLLIATLAVLIWVVVKKKRSSDPVKKRSSSDPQVEIPLLRVSTPATAPKKITSAEDNFGLPQIIENFTRLIQYLPEKVLPYIPKQCIQMKKFLGDGQFGDVHEGLAYNLPSNETKAVRVAIKCLKDDRTSVQQTKFLEEASVLNNFNHPNIVKLLGVCIELDTYWMVFELMEMNLLEYLHTVRPTKYIPSQISLKDILNIVGKIVDGCVFLELMHHIHRDLAARNILLSGRDPNSFIVKIADFGFAHKISRKNYHRPSLDEPFSLEWCAPECVEENLCTHKSDVWSFGVTLWEIVTLGETPYENISSMAVISHVCAGNRLKKPQWCPMRLYKVMLACWNLNPEERPKFVNLKVIFEAFKILPEFVNDDPYPPYSPAIRAINVLSTSNVQSRYTIIKTNDNQSTDEISWEPDENENAPDVEIRDDVRTMSISPSNDLVFKIVPKASLKNKNETLRNEMDHLKRLRHPNIVGLIDVLEDNHNLYLIMERVKGGRLFNYLINRDTFSERIAVGLVKQMFQGVNYLHENNIIHGNLKPENIVFHSNGEESRIMISGFGFATSKHANELLRENSESLDLIAPEVLIQNQFSKEMDVWSLGVITYIIMSGYYPFSAENDDQKTAIEKINDGAYDFDLPQWRVTSAESKDFISKLLKVDPMTRLTCSQALKHPWLIDVTLSTINALTVQEQLKKLHYREKWKKIAYAVSAIRKLQDLRGDLQLTPYFKSDGNQLDASSAHNPRQTGAHNRRGHAVSLNLQGRGHNGTSDQSETSLIPLLSYNVDLLDESYNPEEKKYFIDHF